MSVLDSWTRGEHVGDGRTFPTYRKGAGPGVVVIHEIPGLTPGGGVRRGGGGRRLHRRAAAPVRHARRRVNPLTIAKTFRQVCVSKEFTKLATRETSPVAGWLRSLARDLHAELGGPGVGALGMCFTGGFALAMMVDDAVAAPVLCQPSAPFPVGKERAADLNLSPADLETVKARAAGGCQVLGFQYDKDPATGTRFATLDRELGEAFIRVDFPGRKHSTVTLHRQQEAVDRILSFFSEKLSG